MKHAYLLYTGFGKTKMCLDKIINANNKPRTLVISTKKIVESSWPGEINKWYAGKLSYDYLTGTIKPKDRMDIVNKQQDILGISTSMLDWYISNTCSVKRKAILKGGRVKYYYDTDEILPRFNLIIIDESTLFKNSQSNRFKDLKKWVHKAKNVMILSATPTPKNIEDVFSQVYLLDGGKRLGPNITKFREHWGIPIALPNGRNKWQYSTQAVDDILGKIQDITTSIPAPPKPLFPEPILKKLTIKADPQTTKVIKDFKEDYITKLSTGDNLIAMTKNQLINKVSQMASGDVYNKNTVVHLNDIKLRAVKHIISRKTTPILIMYNYVFDKEKLLTIPGAKLLETAQDHLDWNANKIPIGILSPSSSAHGLNLQDSDCVDVIWFSPIWDTEKWIQANARVARRGQKNVVTITVLLLKESYDEYMFNMCITKFHAQYNILTKLS